MKTLSLLLMLTVAGQAVWPVVSVSIDCGFEKDFCRWSVNFANKAKFVRWTGQGPHFKTGIIKVKEKFI